MGERVPAKLWLDRGFALDSASPHEAEPTVTTLGGASQVDSDELGIK